MPPSHPPTLLTLVKRVLRRESPLPGGTRLLLAVSGGPDSMALLHVLSQLRAQLKLVLFAHGVDHGLREAARTELETAASLARDCEVPFSSTRVAVPEGGNLQARAREARYGALRQEAERVGATVIATAHHADDRAETVLLRLLRGAPAAGLGVLPVRAGDLIRPMIRATRTDIVRHLERHRVPHCEDPSNDNTRFLRVRVRHELLPLMKQLSPQIVNHLTSLADQVLMGDPTEVHDEAGGKVALNRAQTAQLVHLVSSGRPGGRIALADGIELCIDATSGVARVEEPGRSSTKPRRKAPKC